MDRRRTRALALPVSLAGQQAPRTATGSGGITLVHELAIGTDTAGPDYEIVDIGHAAPLCSGSVFVSVMDGIGVLIRKYDHSARFRCAIGRSGSGPGEYRDTEGLAVVDDSLLVVSNRGNGRMVLFDTAGAFRRTFRVSGYGGGPIKMLAFFTDGTFAVRALLAEHAPVERASRRRTPR